MNGAAYFIVGYALLVAVLATVAWGLRYRRKPFHPEPPEVVFRVLSIAASLSAAVVVVVVAAPGEQTGLLVVWILLVAPAQRQALQDRRAWSGYEPMTRSESGNLLLAFFSILFAFSVVVMLWRGFNWFIFASATFGLVVGFLGRWISRSNPYT